MFLFLVEDCRVREEGEVVELSHIFKGSVKSRSSVGRGQCVRYKKLLYSQFEFVDKY